MSLTIVAINHAKPKKKTYRLYDEKGLYLEVTKSGGKLCRLKYRFGGKEKRLAIGTYPEISLKDARAARDAARTQLAAGTDPSEYKKLMKARALEALLESNLIIKTRERWFQGEHSSRCALYAVTWLGIAECPGKDLDVKANPRPSLVFSVENKTSIFPETIPNQVQNRGWHLERDGAGRYVSPSKQGL